MLDESAAAGEVKNQRSEGRTCSRLSRPFRLVSLYSYYSGGSLDSLFSLVASSVLPLTAQPEAPAFALAGASGWAVNDSIYTLSRHWLAMRRASSPNEIPVPYWGFAASGVAGGLGLVGCVSGAAAWRDIHSLPISEAANSAYSGIVARLLKAIPNFSPISSSNAAVAAWSLALSCIETSTQ